MVTFSEEIILADSPEGYTLYWDKCCRNGRTNIDRTDTACTGAEVRFSEVYVGEGTTYSCKIPRPSVALRNNSPVVADSVVNGCIGRPLYYQFKFIDPDGDSLSYKLANSFCMELIQTFLQIQFPLTPIQPMVISQFNLPSPVLRDVERAHRR
jgi:hypothetical protein